MNLELGAGISEGVLLYLVLACSGVWRHVGLTILPGYVLRGAETAHVEVVFERLASVVLLEGLSLKPIGLRGDTNTV